MFLTISDAAKAKLTQRLTPQTKIVLDFDDGVGPFSDAGMCTLDVAFNIILCESDQITNDFDKKIVKSGLKSFHNTSKCVIVVLTSCKRGNFYAKDD